MLTHSMFRNKTPVLHLTELFDFTIQVKKSKSVVKDYDFDDVGKDDLTGRIHAPHPLPYQVRNFR